MSESKRITIIIKELKHHVIILENKLNDIGYHYFLLTNDEFELDIEFIKTFFKNNCNNSAKWIVFIILLLKKKIKYYENLKKKDYLVTKVFSIIILAITFTLTLTLVFVFVFVFVQPMKEALESQYETVQPVILALESSMVTVQPVILALDTLYGYVQLGYRLTLESLKTLLIF
jgi:hypothetical protein